MTTIGQRPPPKPRAQVDEVVEQRARLEGSFTADLVHDVLVRAKADVKDAGTTVSMGEPELLGSKVTKDEDGHLVVEDQVAVRLVLTTRRELTAMVDLLDRAHVENGVLKLDPVEHTVSTGAAP